MKHINQQTQPFQPIVTATSNLNPPSPAQNTSALLSRAEAAIFLGVSKGTLEVWASTQRYNLPFVKIGRLAKYRMCDLEAFIQSRLTNIAADKG